MIGFEPISELELTAERLRYLVTYDPDTGKFRRNVSTSPRALAGQECGYLDSKGYTRLRVDGKCYLAHRLAWLYMTGEWPKDEIDHKNRIRTDNRWENLREADAFTNKRNTPAYRNNASGFKGVSWHRDSKKWRSRIRIGGKEVNLGLYDTPQEANAAYEKAAVIHFGQYARAA